MWRLGFADLLAMIAFVYLGYRTHTSMLQLEWWMKIAFAAAPALVLRWFLQRFTAVTATLRYMAIALLLYAAYRFFDQAG